MASGPLSPSHLCHPRACPEDPSCRTFNAAMADHDRRMYFVYILASRPRGTLYVGVTNSILTRIEQHRAGTGSAFTKRHKVHLLVWYEIFDDINAAIQKEKTIKHYVRDWKINLIERDNPRWSDLYPALPGAEQSVKPSKGVTPSAEDPSGSGV